MKYWTVYEMIRIKQGNLFDSLVMKKSLERWFNMKGYVVESGYMGYIDGEYRLFADERLYDAFLDRILSKMFHKLHENEDECHNEMWIFYVLLQIFVIFWKIYKQD